jgi:hypothetical protein
MEISAMEQELRYLMIAIIFHVILLRSYFEHVSKEFALADEPATEVKLKHLQQTR